MAVTMQEQISLTTEECCSCGIIFALPTSLRRKLKESGEFFYCPNGHSQHYTETEAQRLQKQLDRERRTREAWESRANSYERQRDTAQRSAAAHKGQATKLKKRAAAGVCPCCNRTVSQLAKHMEAKHPGFVQESKEKTPS